MHRPPAIPPVRSIPRPRARRGVVPLVLIGLLAPLLVTVAVQAPASAAVPMVVRVDAGPVPELRIDLSAGVAYTVATSALTAGADPVLHVLGPDGRELGVDHGSGGPAGARLGVTPTVTGRHTIVLHNRAPGGGGHASVSATWTCVFGGRPLRCGTVIGTNVAFAGGVTFLDDLRAGEQVGTVRLPGGAGPQHHLYLLDGLRIVQIERGNGIGGAADLNSSTIGDRTLVVGVAPGAQSGKARVVRNDARLTGHDVDADGLGNELEASLATCSTRSGVVAGFDCARATDPRDTDGDGIFDNWEVLGRPSDGAGPAQPLALWGADPRHKDLFAELDHIVRPGEVAERMTNAEAAAFAAVWQDQAAPLTPAEATRHASSLANPDGRPGVALHLDTGVAPDDPTDPIAAARSGNWGGWSTADAGVECKDKPWQSRMASTRQGIFFYALTYLGGGGSTAFDQNCFSFGLHSPRAGAHELGHALGLGHGGSQVKTEPNCKANYPSAMNYADLYRSDISFSDGVGSPPLDNTALTEWGWAAGDLTTLPRLERTFGYLTDRTAGHVDWNRDGRFAPAGTTVRAAANSGPGLQCEATRWNTVVADTAARLTPAVVRTLGRTYTFSATGSTLRYRSTASTFDCPVTAETGCGATSFGAAGVVPLVVGSGLDVERFADVATGRPRLLAVAVDPGGALRSAVGVPDLFGNVTWGAVTLVHPAVAGEPSLAALGGSSSTVRLAFSAHLSFVVHLSLWEGSGWSTPVRALTAAGAALPVQTTSSPALAYAITPFRPGVRGLYAAVVDNAGELNLWYRDFFAWVDASSVLESIRGVRGKPSMVFVPERPGAGTGVFHLAWLDTADAVRQARSYTRVERDAVTGAATFLTPTIGLQGYFDNQWHTASGIDLFHEAGVDTNLRAAMASTIPSSAGRVLFKPKADGITAGTYGDHDDWARIRTGLCRSLAKGGGSSRPTCA